MSHQASSSQRRGRGHALYKEIKARILDGTYPAGMPLPSTRISAAQLGLSRTTVSAVHEQLAAEGYLETRAGSASRVAAGVRSPGKQPGTVCAGETLAERPVSPTRLSAMGRRILSIGLPSLAAPSAEIIDFAYGPLAGTDFPTLAWSRAARQVERERPARLAYDDPRGDLGFRRAVQAYLARSRGLSCSIEQLVVVSGSQQAIDLCARLLVDPGDTVVVESPGYRMAHHVFSASGASLVGIDVDSQGLCTDALAQVQIARLVYVTPTHQFPLGSFLSASRRSELLTWAAKRGAWVIEDDYDGEYRVGLQQEATLRSMDRDDVVIYMGTFSKSLSAKLRLGYMVVPQALVPAFCAAKRLVDRHTPSATQRTLTRLLESGVYERHLRRIRRSQDCRQSILLEALNRHFPGWVKIQGTTRGLHVVAWLDDLPSSKEGSLVEGALAEGVQVYPISPHYVEGQETPSQDRPVGLLLGYALLSPDKIEAGIRRLAKVVDQLHGCPPRERSLIAPATDQRARRD